jgi:outer membrane lipoprotein SlyB
MARSHHRKKHKTQLRQYQQSNEGTSKGKKRKVSGTIAVIGTIVGMSVGYFTTNGTLLWIAFGAVIGGLAGFLIGRHLDKVS